MLERMCALIIVQHEERLCQFTTPYLRVRFYVSSMWLPLMGWGKNPLDVKLWLRGEVAWAAFFHLPHMLCRQECPNGELSFYGRLPLYSNRRRKWGGGDIISVCRQVVAMRALILNQLINWLTGYWQLSIWVTNNSVNECLSSPNWDLTIEANSKLYLNQAGQPMVDLAG